MDILFTVVVPSLNQGAYLEQALLSLFAQHAGDLEIIVVDGGSTDGSVEIIEKFAGMLGGERFGGSSKVLKCESSEVGGVSGGNGQLAIGEESAQRGFGDAESGESAGEVLKFESSKVGGSGTIGNRQSAIGNGKSSRKDAKTQRVKRSALMRECESAKVRETATANGAKLANENNFRTLELPHFRTRFLWCSEPDRGQSHAFNKGFARASGRFLFWLNADDLLLPGTLDRVRAYLAAHGAAEWIAGNQIYINADGRVIRCSCGNRWHDFLYRQAPVHVYGPSAFFTKELWNRVGGTDEQLRYCMDWDLWLKFKKAGARFERLNHYCWALRQHGGSKTQGGERDKEPIHWKEIHEMCRRNGLVVTTAGVWFQRFWRLFSGCYVRSVIDTVRWRGKILQCEAPRP